MGCFPGRIAFAGMSTAPSLFGCVFMLLSASYANGPNSKYRVVSGLEDQSPFF